MSASTKKTLSSRLLGTLFNRDRFPRGGRGLDYPFADFHSELKILRLAGQTYDVMQYAQRLADYLGLVIKVDACDDLEHPLLRAQMSYYGIAGGLFHEPSTRTVWIAVPTSLDMKAQVLVVYHELAHVAAGHPFKRAQVLQAKAHEQDLLQAFPKDFRQRDDGLFEPTKRLARQPVPDICDAQRTLARCENEADARARYALKAGLYGENIYYRDEFFFAFKDRPSFVPVGWPLSTLRRKKLKD